MISLLYFSFILSTRRRGIPLIVFIYYIIIQVYIYNVHDTLLHYTHILRQSFYNHFVKPAPAVKSGNIQEEDESNENPPFLKIFVQVIII